jgi:hypothetical protein
VTSSIVSPFSVTVVATPTIAGSIFGRVATLTEAPEERGGGGRGCGGLPVGRAVPLRRRDQALTARRAGATSTWCSRRRAGVVAGPSPHGEWDPGYRASPGVEAPG